MSEKKILVPEGMLQAALARLEMPNTEPYRVQVGKSFEAGLRWLSENPIMPTGKQLESFRNEWDYAVSPTPKDYLLYAITWFQQRMFLAAEPPLEITDLLWDAQPFRNTGAKYRHDNAVIEAYQRGRKAADK